MASELCPFLVRVHVHVHKHACIFVYACACLCVYVRVCRRFFMYMFHGITSMHLSGVLRGHWRKAPVRAHVCACVRVCFCARMRVCMCVCACAFHRKKLVKSMYVCTL